jgi:hypothetical protein
MAGLSTACNSNFACLHGACVTDNATGSLACSCQAGWEDDNTLFHQANCGLPNDVLFYSFIAAAVTSAVLALLFGYHARTAKGAIKSLVRVVLVSIATYPLCALSMYLERGVFEASSILLALNVAAVTDIAHQTMVLNLRPILAVHHQLEHSQVIKQINMLMRILEVSLTSMGVVLAITCRNSRVYNQVLVAFLLQIVVIAVIAASYQYRFGKKLIGIIDMTTLSASASAERGGDLSQGQKSILRARDKLAKALKGHIANIIITVIVMGVVIGCFFGFNQQLPFVWCLWPVLTLNQIARYVIVFILMRNDVARVESSSANDSSPAGAKDAVLAHASKGREVDHVIIDFEDEKANSASKGKLAG